VRCQACGHESLPGAAYCEMCGARIPRAPAVDKSRIKDHVARVLAAVSKRGTTDTIIPAAIPPVVIIGVILLYLIVIAALFGVALDMIEENPDQTPSTEELIDRSGPAFVIMEMASIAFYAFLGVLFYFLIRRLNRHFEREAELRNALIELVKASAQDTVATQAITSNIYELEYLWEEARSVEQKRNPTIWGIIMASPAIMSAASLTLTAGGDSAGSVYSKLYGIELLINVLWIIASLYIIYILGKTIYEHDSRWLGFATSARGAMTALGFPAGPEFSVGRIKSRSFILYLILTVITVGLFMIYWLYVLVKDPNEHFESQWEFEDNIVAALT